MVTQTPYIPQSYYSAGSETFNESFQKWRVDTADILEELKHKLKGEIKNDSEKWIKVGIPLLNNTGVESIVSFISFYLNRVVILSNFDQEDIAFLIYGLSTDLRAEILVNIDYWEIDSPQILKRVIMDFILAAIHRAKDGGERDAFGKIMRTIERIEPSDKKSSFLSSLNVFAKKEEK